MPLKFFPTRPHSALSPQPVQGAGDIKIRHDLGLLGAHRPMGETSRNKQMPCKMERPNGGRGGMPQPSSLSSLCPMPSSLSPLRSAFSPSCVLPCCSLKLSWVKLCPLKQPSSNCQERIFQAYSGHYC